MRHTNQTSRIRYYFRCLITREAVQTAIKRKGKPRASVAPRDLSEDESDPEHSGAPQRQTGAALPPLPFRAPEAPGMLPPAELPWMEATSTQARLVDNEGNLDIAHGLGGRSPTTPGKRKAMSFQGQLSSGKLQKVLKDGRAATGSPRGRPRDVWSLPESPTPQFPVRPAGLAPVSRNQREDTCDSDRTWTPSAPRREGTVGSETEMDDDEVMVDTQGEYWN